MLISSAKCGVANCHSQTQCIWSMPKNSPWLCYWAATPKLELFSAYCVSFALIMASTLKNLETENTTIN